VLLNTPYAPDEVWDAPAQGGAAAIIDKKLKVYTIDAYAVAREAGMGGGSTP
jgi:pyruvate-ferredoxin/flavodoxin oxidoreductase